MQHALRHCPFHTHLHEAGVHGGCGADHVNVGSGCGTDALQGRVGWGRERKVLWLAVLGTGAAGRKAVECVVEGTGSGEGFPCCPEHAFSVQGQLLQAILVLI